MSVPAESSHPGEEGRASPHARYTKQSGTATDRLTDDLLVEILSRVPAKSLFRFRCVSSHWLALIDHPYHRKRLPQTPAGFFYDNKYTVEWFLQPPLHFTSFPGKRCPPIDTSCSFLPNHERIHLLDCCNGLSSSAAGATPPPRVKSPVTSCAIPPRRSGWCCRAPARPPARWPPLVWASTQPCRRISMCLSW
uniref:F-box domain-containing protein n=1 Tax=Aegilops tauschii subsp. strangulata TaxID=200361 RepID=A0A453SSG6_AEGTS